VTGHLAALAGGYLLGSLPFGYWVGRTRGVDLRRLGSGNTGATNALRVLGLRLGALVLALDMAKGAGAVALGLAVGSTGFAVVAGALAVVGHTFPVFLGFGGGKGVATAGGVMFALVPLVGVAVLGVWLVVLLLSRYVSLASLTAATAFPALVALGGGPWPVTAFALFVTVVVLWRHRPNIARLRAGTEHRVRLRRSTA
jgi:glycerol-3-phosphate acyltransferase PlsY